MEGKHLVLSCILTTNHVSIPTYTLIDTGATGYTFIDEDFASHHKLPLLQLKNPRTLQVIIARPVSAGNIIHIARLGLTVKDETEEPQFFLNMLGQYLLVMGIVWLQQHDASICLSTTTVPHRVSLQPITLHHLQCPTCHRRNLL